MQGMNDINFEQKTSTSLVNRKNEIEKAGSQLSLPPFNMKKKGGRWSDGTGADAKKPIAPPRKNESTASRDPE